MRYILITREGCPYCSMAVELLKEAKLEHNVVNFQRNQSDLLNEVKEAHDWKTVPMVFMREGNKIEFLGGYTDLKNYLEKNV